MSFDTPTRTQSEILGEALAIEAQSHSVAVEGANVHYREWDGPSSATPVMLVHGMLAHSHWWDAVAAWLSQDRRVVAIDLSGMGDSDRRPNYSRAQHAREIVAVTKDADLDDALLVAHSYGGDPAIRAARQLPGLYHELALLDSRLMLPGVKSAAMAAGMGNLARKIYISIAEARARFRLLPDSPFADATLMEHVFKNSIVECEGGWSWKYDAMLDPEADADDPLHVDGMKVPVTFVRGAQSIATPPEQMAITRRHLPFAEVIEIPACGHHIMLDQPVALTALLRAKLN